jgi:hypothetical protein
MPARSVDEGRDGFSYSSSILSVGWVAVAGRNRATEQSIELREEQPSEDENSLPDEAFAPSIDTYVSERSRDDEDEYDLVILDDMTSFP